MALTVLLASSRARAEVPVTLSQPSPEYLSAATQLVAELRAEGYVVEWLTHLADSPCSGSMARANAAGGIWIELGPAMQQGNAVATICYRPASGAIDQTRVLAPLDPPRQLAIATVEALHGLRAQPRPVLAAPRPEMDESRPCVTPPAPTRGTFSLGVAGVIDPTGAGPMIGAELTLVTPFHRHFAAEVSAFVPGWAAAERGADRTLELRTAWIRAGVRWSWSVASAEILVSISAGPALVWASSEPTPPLIGATRVAAAALLSAGVGLVYPQESLFAFYAQAHASRLIPEVDLRVDAGSTRAFGNILLDGALGVAVGWR